MTYALIKNGRVENIIEADAAFAALIAPEWDHVIIADGVEIGYLYQNGAFSPPPDPGPDLRPQLIITAITPDAPEGVLIDMQAGDITCPAGTRLTVTAELRDPDDALVPVTAMFRMPILASDGRERILIAQLTAGICTIGVPLNESGIWTVTEDLINRALAPEQQMRFAGVTAHVYAV